MGLAITLHNMEEWRMASPLAQKTPPWAMMQVGWVVVTLVPLALFTWSIARPQSRWASRLAVWAASIYFANAFLPHLLLFTLSGNYAPGLVTAALFLTTLPLLVVVTAVREDRLTTREAVACVVAGFLSVGPAIFLVIRAVSLFVH